MKKFKRIVKTIELDEGAMNTGKDNLIIKNAVNKIIDSMEWGGNYQITVGSFKFNGLNYETKILVDYMESVEEEKRISEENNSKKDEVKNTKVIAYVDGSFDKNKKLCGSGVVFLKSLNDEMPIDSMSFSSVDKYNMWNIQGECESCIAAIKQAINQGCEEIHIYHDYQGISSWALREWKAKNDYTKGYVKRFDELNKKIKIKFFKVKGHSKDKWNDEADRLAKASLGK